MLDVIEGSNAGSVAGDQAERGHHAPAVSSPLTEEEQVACNAVHRYLV